MVVGVGASGSCLAAFLEGRIIRLTRLRITQNGVIGQSHGLEEKLYIIT